VYADARDLRLPPVKTLSTLVSDSLRRLPGNPLAFGISLVAYKTAADIASKTVTLVVTVAAARTLTPEDFGVMALAMTTGWLLGVASDAGLPMFVATRIAQAHAVGAATRPLVQIIMRRRAQLALAAGTSGLLLAVTLTPSTQLLPFMLIVVHQVFGAMLETVAHVYRGLGRTDIESTLSLAHRGAIALGALAVLAVQPSLLALSLALSLPPVVTFVISRRIAERVTTDGPSFPLGWSRFRQQVAPLGAGVLISALYFRIDVYFLERLHGVEAVGVYNAAFRLVDAVRLFPAAGLAVVYPKLCAATTLQPLLHVSLLLFTAGTVVAAVLFTVASPLLVLIYGGSFEGGGPALQVLSLSVPFFFVNYALTHQLIAWDRQHAYLRVAVTALATNVVFNSVLIPSGAMTGAAYSTLITEAVVFVGCVLALRSR
jgi:O-antigen/teichoic acid export membrane protein